MTVKLSAAGDAFDVRLVIFAAAGAASGNYRRFEADRGVRRPGVDGTREYFVVLPGCAAVVLRLGTEGIGVRELQVSAPGTIMVVARVLAAPLAPPWLPAVSDYVLFTGDRKDAACLRPGLWVPLRPGTPAEPEFRVTVDRLVAALGQSITRANARLAVMPAPGGAALAAQVTMRIAVRSVRIGTDHRVILELGRPAEHSAQYIDLTLNTAPGQDETEGSAGTFTLGGES